MRWIEALKIWNGKKGGAWCVPRKGSVEHAEVKRLMDVGKAERLKKEAEEELREVPPKKLKPRVREEVKVAIAEKKKESKRETVKNFLKRAIEKRRAKKLKEEEEKKSVAIMEPVKKVKPRVIKKEVYKPKDSVSSFEEIVQELKKITEGYKRYTLDGIEYTIDSDGIMKQQVNVMVRKGQSFDYTAKIPFTKEEIEILEKNGYKKVPGYTFYYTKTGEGKKIQVEVPKPEPESKKDVDRFNTEDVDLLYFMKNEKSDLYFKDSEEEVNIDSEIEKAKKFFKSVLPKDLYTRYFDALAEAHTKYTIRYADARREILEDAQSRKDKAAIAEAKKSIKDSDNFKEKYMKLQERVTPILARQGVKNLKDTKYKV